MKQSYTFLGLVVLNVTLCFYAAHEATNRNIYTNAAVVTVIVVSTISALGLALFSLRSVSFLYITRNCIFVLLAVLIFCRMDTLIAVSLGATIILHSLFFSEILLSGITQKIGRTGEDMFITNTPKSVIGWYSFTWGVFWAIFIETIHLFAIDKLWLGVIGIGLAFCVLAVFLPSQLRILLNRCVIVPQGIVISDQIKLTDVVLLPLAKIKSIKKISADDIPKNDSSFEILRSKRTLVLITLNEKTDSFIVRTGVNQTERKDIDSLTISVADSKNFVSAFHARFHKIDPVPMTKAQEKMAEKELGIVTAPRSDSKMPTWRKK